MRRLRWWLRWLRYAFGPALPEMCPGCGGPLHKKPGDGGCRKVRVRQVGDQLFIDR